MTDLDATNVEENEGFSFLEAEPEPCKNFRLDTSREFGLCVCGHPKAAHNAKGANKAAEMLSKLKNNNEQKRSVDSDFTLYEPGDKACNKFRLDPAATEFGMCKCGFKRVDHVTQSENKAALALNKLKQNNQGKYVSDSKIKKGVPCDDYRVDVSATEFGLCLCGFKKEDHKLKDENVAAKMLNALKQRNEERHQKDDKEALGILDDDETGPEATNSKNDPKNNNGDTDSKKTKKKRTGPCVLC